MVSALCGECNNILQHVCLDIEKTAFHFQVYLKLATNDIHFFFRMWWAACRISWKMWTHQVLARTIGFVVVAQFQIVDTISWHIKGQFSKEHYIMWNRQFAHKVEWGYYNEINFGKTSDVGNPYATLTQAIEGRRRRSWLREMRCQVEQCQAGWRSLAETRGIRQSNSLYLGKRIQMTLYTNGKMSCYFNN